MSPVIININPQYLRNRPFCFKSLSIFVQFTPRPRRVNMLSVLSHFTVTFIDNMFKNVNFFLFTFLENLIIQTEDGWSAAETYLRSPKITNSLITTVFLLVNVFRTYSVFICNGVRCACTCIRSAYYNKISLL